MNLLRSCKKAAELMTLAQDEPLSTLDKLRLKLHVSICGNCRNVEQQIAQIGMLMRNPLEGEDAPPDHGAAP